MLDAVRNLGDDGGRHFGIVDCKYKQRRIIIKILLSTLFVFSGEVFIFHTNAWPSISPNVASNGGVLQHIEKQVKHNHHTIAVLHITVGEQINVIEYCNLILVESRKWRTEIPKILKKHSSKGYKVEEVTFEEMIDVVDKCKDFPRKDDVTPSPQTIGNLFSLIYPGTNWCGVNDIANNYFDLGVKEELDKCCRAHDYCPVKIMPSQKLYDVTNTNSYTMSHCECDQRLYTCLKNLNTLDARNVKNVFFKGFFYPGCILHECPRICYYQDFYTFKRLRLTSDRSPSATPNCNGGQWLENEPIP